MDKGFPLGLAAPARRALTSVGVSRIEELSVHTERSIANLHGMGPNAMAKLKEYMETAGVSYAAELPGTD